LNTYYEKRFDYTIKELKYTKEDALIEIVQFYLEDKPKKIKNEKISQIERDEWFWGSDFLQQNKSTFLKSNLYALALKKNLKNKTLFNLEMIKDSAAVNSSALRQAIKYSKIFLEKNNANYIQLKQILDTKEFVEFFEICDKVENHYCNLQQHVKEQENLLLSYGYVDLLFLISFSTLKHAHIQLDTMNPSYLSIYGMTLTKMVQDRISQPDRRKKTIDQRQLFDKEKKYFMQKIANNEVPEELESFEKIYEAYEILTLFEQNILYSFLYDENYQSVLLEDKVTLSPVDMNKHIKTEMHSEKLQGMFKYYEEVAMTLFADGFKENYRGKEENYDMNFYQELLHFQTLTIMYEIYGLDFDIFIDNDKTLDLAELIYSGYALSMFYAFEFLMVYTPILQKNHKENFWQSHREIVIHSTTTHKKNRFPLIYKTINKVVSEIHGNQQIDFGDKIIDFWSHDLKKEKTNNIKYPTLFEKPFIKIDDFVFTFPWLMSFSGTSPDIFINSLLRVHSNRLELMENGKKNNVRQEEVVRSEKRLAEFFEKLGFAVENGYKHSEAKKYGTQEMDIVASRDGHLFILELKSTYMRESFESNWEHKTRSLRKAGYQLQKRKKYIEKLLKENDQEFMNKFGRPEHIHTWIVDTSFESDHEYFSGSLKVSTFEVKYALNEANDEFYPNGFNVDMFIKNIESEKLWEKINIPQITKEEVTYTI